MWPFTLMLLPTHPLSSKNWWWMKIFWPFCTPRAAFTVFISASQPFCEISRHRWWISPERAHFPPPSSHAGPIWDDPFSQLGGASVRETSLRARANLNNSAAPHDKWCGRIKFHAAMLSHHFCRLPSSECPYIHYTQPERASVWAHKSLCADGSACCGSAHTLSSLDAIRRARALEFAQ